MRLNGPSRTATHMDNSEERRQLSSRAAPWCRTGAAARTTRGQPRDGQFAMRRGGGELSSGPGSSSQFYPDPAARLQPGWRDAAWSWAVLRNHRLQQCARHALHHVPTTTPTSDPLAIFIDAITATRMPGAACPHYLLSNRLQETTSQLSLPLLKRVRNFQDRRHNLLRAFNSFILSWQAGMLHHRQRYESVHLLHLIHRVKTRTAMLDFNGLINMHS